MPLFTIPAPGQALGTTCLATLPDSPATLAALGLLAYLSADVAHHVAGHGGACLALGGQLLRLTSIRADCSCTGAAIDLAGPLANLLLGAAAWAAGRWLRSAAAPTRLFLLLTAGFNLFYFAGQLAYCAAANTDDWWWPLRQARVPAAGRYLLAALGLALYGAVVPPLARQLASFATPRHRATRIVGLAWLAAGVVAAATAASDHPVSTALLAHALPQALLLPAGFWLLPARAAQMAAKQAPPLAFSWHWVMAALVAGAGSVLLLGPGISFH